MCNFRWLLLGPMSGYLIRTKFSGRSYMFNIVKLHLLKCSIVCAVYSEAVLYIIEIDVFIEIGIHRNLYASSFQEISRKLEKFCKLRLMCSEAFAEKCIKDSSIHRLG